MIQDFKLNINNIENITLKEKKFREDNLKIFNEKGFPNKRSEEWKFTDLNSIISENFKKLNASNTSINDKKNYHFDNNTEYNCINLIDGQILDIQFNQDKDKLENFKFEPSKKNINKNSKACNSLINLNNALCDGGYSLEVFKNYKFNAPILIFNYISEEFEDKIINSQNSITLNNNTDLDLIELNFSETKKKFFYNNYTDIIVGKNASLRHYSIQKKKNNGFYYKFIKGTLSENSNYEDYIFTSGLKFNKIEEDIDLNGEESKCVIQSGLFLDKDSHQEIKTKINHLKPNCQSYQKIKNVLNQNCKGVYQGKIFVKDVAQKTDAYQLSKALLLSDTSEFNAKPELEIYADDVKCSHGSTSGSMNEESIYYLMTRGIPRNKAIELLTKAFLLELISSISNLKIKELIEKYLDKQINEY